MISKDIHIFRIKDGRFIKIFSKITTSLDDLLEEIYPSKGFDPFEARGGITKEPTDEIQIVKSRVVGLEFYEHWRAAVRND